MHCPKCMGTGLLQWPNFPAYEWPGMGYSSPTRLNKVHNPLREGTPCPTCHGTGFLEDNVSVSRPAPNPKTTAEAIHQESIITRAEQMVQDGYFADAEDYLNRTIKKRLTSAERLRAHELRGIARLEQNKLKEAAQDFVEATKNKPWSAPLSNFHLGICRMGLGEYQKAISLFSRFAVINGPLEVRARLRRGVCYYQQGRYGAAINDLNRAVKLDRKNPFLLYYRAKALRAQKKPADALNDFDLAIKLDPEYAFAHLHRGDCLTDLGRVTEAIDAYTNARRLFTKSNDRKGIKAVELRIATCK
jgi:tetratricopeptide (TPR) repeat protein